MQELLVFAQQSDHFDKNQSFLLDNPDHAMR